MKPIKLDLEGVNSYSDKTSIDFEFLTSRGIFGIFGRTGSGKSTILDAITLALYGNISRGTKEYINSNSKKAFIEFEFELLEAKKRQRYKISRRFKRKSGGNSSVSDYVRFMKKNDLGEYEVVADKVGEANEMVKSLLGLEEGDFLKSVVLPQGKFGEFLSLGGKDRRNMLERIFNLSEYGSELSKKIAREKRSVEDEKNIIDAKLAEYPDINPEELKKLEEEKDSLKKERDNREKELKNIEKTYEDVKQVYELCVEKEKKTEKLEELKKNQDHIESLRLSLDISNQFERFTSYIDRSDENIRNIEKTRLEIGGIEKKLSAIEKEKSLKEVELEENSSKVLALEEEKFKNTVEYEFRQGIEEGYFLEKEALRLKDDMSEKEGKIDQVKLKIEALERERVDIKNEISRLKVDIEKIDADIEEESKKNVLSEEDLEIEKEKIRGLDLRIEDFKRGFDKRSKIIENNQGILSQIEVLNEEIENIQLRIRFENDRLDLINKELEKRIQKLSDELKSLWLEQDHPDENCPLCGSRVDVKKLIDEGNKLKHQDIRDENQDVDEINKNIVELEKSIVEKRAKISFLEKNLEDNKEEIKNIEKEYKKDEYEEILDLRSSLIEMFESEKEKSRKKQEVLSGLKEKRMTLEKNLLELDKNLALKDLEEESSVKSKDDLKVQIEKMNLESKNILSQTEAIREKLEVVDILQEKKDIEKKDFNLSRINDELRGLSEKKDLLKKEVDKLGLEINALKIKLETLKNSLASIKSTLNDEVSYLLKNFISIFKSIDTKIKTNINTNIDINANIDTNTDIDINTNTNIDTNNLVEYIPRYQEDFYGYLTEIEFSNNGIHKDDVYKEYGLKEYGFKDYKYNDDKDYDHKYDSLKKIFYNLKSVFENIVLDMDTVLRYEKIIEDHTEIKRGISLRLSILEDSLKNRYASLDDVEKKREELDLASEGFEKIKNEAIRIDYIIAEMKKNLDIVKELGKKLSEVEKNLSDIVDLEKVMRGNKFVEYLSQLHLKNIVFDASDRLSKITGGRYSLEINSDYMFIIRDNFNGGMRRSADTLSGGETFLTSLSLALSLSSQIQLKGSVPLEFFFLDEGFGTLDEDLLDTVMESLEKLQGENMSIGIISHVEELKNRIPMKLLVSLDQETSSSTVKIQEG